MWIYCKECNNKNISLTIFQAKFSFSFIIYFRGNLKSDFGDGIFLGTSLTGREKIFNGWRNKNFYWRLPLIAEKKTTKLWTYGKTLVRYGVFEPHFFRKNKSFFCSGSCNEGHVTSKLQNKMLIKHSWTPLESFGEIFQKHTWNFSETFFQILL